MKIAGTTRLAGIMGWPVAHSRSPLLHGFWLAETGTELKLEQRGKLFDARVASMPFVPHRYHRKGAV